VARLRAVLFDAFGTLLDARGLHETATAHILAELGLEGLNPAELHREWDGEALALIPDGPPFPSMLDLFREGLVRCLAKRGFSLGGGELDRAMDILVTTFREGTKSFEGAHEIVSFCRELGLGTALVSNADAGLLRYLLTETGLESVLDVIIISDEVGLMKPDARIFELALSRLGVRAQEAIMVGDSELDIEGARRAGVRAALVVRGPESPHLPGGVVPDLIVGGLVELKGPIASMVLRGL